MRYCCRSIEHAYRPNCPILQKIRNKCIASCKFIITTLLWTGEFGRVHNAPLNTRCVSKPAAGTIVCYQIFQV